ncbi:MAG: TIGR02710 family CRISPR-associated CARF protein [Acidobacteriota bacterium]
MVEADEQSRGTILTIGLTDEPVVFSLKQIQPDYAAFICTPASRKTLDKVVHGLHQSSVWTAEVDDDPAQIGRLVQQFYAAFRWLSDKCGLKPGDIYVDPTLGRKWMSAGATMAASYLGLNMMYTDVKFVNGKPDPGTMRFVPLGNAYDQTGFLEAEKGRDLFNRSEFSAASEVFRRLHPSLSASADLYRGLALLAQGLQRWQLFEHYETSLRKDFDDALECLGRCAYSDSTPPGFVTFIEQIRILAAAIEVITIADKPALVATIDLVLNAERRIAQGRYDDAVARAYRALESLSQNYLASFGLHAGQPDYGHLTATQRSALEKYLPAFPEKIALENGWVILWALGHPAAKEIFHLRGGQLQNKFLGILEARNNSILAHGWGPVGQERAGGMVKRLKDLLCKIEPSSAASMERLRIPPLPPFWSHSHGSVGF